MFAELGCLAGGMIPGRLLRHSKKAQKITTVATTASIYALLFILGAKLGGDAALFGAIATLGLQGVAISFFCTMGSVFCVLPAQRWFCRRSAARPGENADASRDEPKGRLLSGFLGSLYILGFFCLGVLLARGGLLPAWLSGGNASLYILWIMLFCVGLGIGFDLGSLLIVREMGLRVALVPLLAIAGTGLGALAASGILPGLVPKETLLVGAGFGYYSLSSVLISNHGLVALGSVALISNVFRELFTLLFTPLLARLLGPLAPVAAAGAPGMDTCLPVIVRFTGERYGIVSLFNGLVMTMLVPFLVPFLLMFF